MERPTATQPNPDTSATPSADAIEHAWSRSPSNWAGWSAPFRPRPTGGWMCLPSRRRSSAFVMARPTLLGQLGTAVKAGADAAKSDRSRTVGQDQPKPHEINSGPKRRESRCARQETPEGRAAHPQRQTLRPDDFEGQGLAPDAARARPRADHPSINASFFGRVRRLSWYSRFSASPRDPQISEYTR